MEIVLNQVFIGRFQKAADSLLTLMQSYPGMEMGHHLLSHLTTLRDYVREHVPFPIEVILLDSPDEEQARWLLHFLQLEQSQYTELTESVNQADRRFSFYAQPTAAGSGASYTYRVYNSAHFPVRDTASIRPAMKLALWFGEENPPADELEPIQFRLAAEGGVLVHAFRSGSPLLQSMDDLRVLAQPLDQLPETLEVLIEQQKLRESMPLMYGMAVVQGLERISDAFDQFVAQQEKDIRTKKFNAQQDINAVKQEEKLNFRDLFQQLKGSLQRDFNEFERGIGDQLQRIGQKYNSQSLMAAVEQQVMQVQQLEEEDFAGARRMRLPAGTREQLQRTLMQSLSSQIDQDLFSLKEFLKHESAETQQLLTKHHIEFSYQPRMQLNISRIQSNMQEYIQFQQKYETEKKKAQPMEYVRAAMAPFMGVASIFLVKKWFDDSDAGTKGVELKKPSFIDEFMKEYGIYIGCILAVFAVYTFYNFYKNNKLRSAHDYDVELNRMRDSLVSESKSMIRKVTDEWGRELSMAIREELNGMVNQLDSAFAEAAEVHKEKIQQSQQSVQRRTQGLEQRKRSHEAAVKNKDAFDRSLAQFKGEIYQQYHQTLAKL